MKTTELSAQAARGATVTGPVPHIGFLGAGWTGRNRMSAIAESGAGRVTCAPTLERLLEHELDGVMIATPSALHADQAVRVLQRGLPVFCQRPLARNSKEAARVVAAARAADRLLAVDFSYRHSAAARAVRDRVRSGDLGDVFAADLVLHDAHGPEDAWFYDRALSGGGCAMDLGMHLVDLALWVLDFPAVVAVTSRLYARGGALMPRATGDGHVVEDYAIAQLDLATGTTVRLSCSWRLSAGRDAVIEGSFHGTRASAALRNVNGSLHELVAEQHRGSTSETLVASPDAWGGRAAIQWAQRLRESPRFSPEAERVIEVSRVLDRIYAESPR